MRLVRSLLTLTLLAFVAWAAPAADAPSAEEAANLSVEGPRFSVAVTHQTECCPKTVELTVRRAGGDARPITMEGRLQRLRSLELAGEDRLLVIGDLRYGGTGLWIADLETLCQETEIWNYGYSVSPSGRWLAYETHYPRLGGSPSSRRSIFMLYDLAAPPPNGSGPGDQWPEPSLGRPIFPEENVEQETGDIFAAEHAYSLVSPFLWSEDDRRLLFLVGTFHDESLEQRECSIVRVDVGRDGSVDAVERALLRPQHVRFRGKPRQEALALDRSLCFYAEELEWADGEPLRVVAELGEGWARELGPAAVVIEVP